MTAFQEDFLQTIVNVSWPSLEMVFGFQLGNWDAVAHAGGDLTLDITVPSSFVGTKFSPVIPKSKFLVSQNGISNVLWTPTASGLIHTPLCVIHAWLGKKLQVVGTSVTWEGAVVLVSSGTFNPSQVVNPPFTSDKLTIDFIKKTLSWQH